MNILEKINSPSDLKKCSHKELSLLAQEIRDFLIENVTKTGGHLAPNLGVVELTIALHYVFDIPRDSLIWDVGHQSYVHKILTGRKHLFPTLRQKNGLSGYPSPEESNFDLIHAGHSSTSVSLGVGVATAKKMDNDTSTTISFIGDGSFTSGMVYEALNDASWRDLPLLIILNDNQMSISANVGGIAKHLENLRTSKAYLYLKRGVTGTLSSSKFGEGIYETLFNIKSMIKNKFFERKNMFENLGVAYLGPFNGHDIFHLIAILEEAKKRPKPLLLHILTEKGLGHEASQNDPANFHGISAQNDNLEISIPKGQSWSSVFGEEMNRLAEEDKNIVVITAAMREGTGLYKYSQNHPKQFIDVGIAEQHAVTCAVGLAIQGKIPIVAIYSTFLQRSFDQIIHDISLAQYPVILCLDRAGLVPGDGETHQGVLDISYLRMIPNMTLMSPLTQKEFSMMLDFSLALKKPVAIRYPKDIAPKWEKDLPPISLGQGVELIQGDDGVLVIYGSLLEETRQAILSLQKSGKNYGLYHLRFAKPIAPEVISYLEKHPHIVLLEEGIHTGSVGEYLKTQLPHKNLLVKNIGDEIPSVNTREGLLSEYRLDTPSIVEDILKEYP